MTDQKKTFGDVPIVSAMTSTDRPVVWREDISRSVTVPIGDFANAMVFAAGNIARPVDYGATGSGDHTQAFTDMINAVNANPAIGIIDVSGVWNTNGNLPNLSRAKITVQQSSGKITRTAAGRVFNSTGAFFSMTGVEIDGGAYSGAVVQASGANPFITHNTIYGGTDNAITLQTGATGAIVADNILHDTGGAGIGLGNTPYAWIGPRNTIYNTAVEGIQSNGGTLSHIIENVVHDCGGIAGIAGNDCDRLTVRGNTVYNCNNGIQIGQKGIIGSYRCIFDDNTLHSNTKMGLYLRNYYRNCIPTAITKASPAVVTFTRKAITGITLGKPMLVTAVAHGKSEGAQITINGVVGTTELNGNIYLVHVVDADTLALLDTDTGAAINGAPKTPYVSGGFVDHGFEGGHGNVAFSGLGGMVELNGQSVHIRSATASTITLENGDGSDFSTLSYTAFTAGGLAYVGEMTHNSIVTNNVMYNNTTADCTIWDGGGLGVLPKHVIAGNQWDDSKVYLFDTTGSTVSGAEIVLAAALTSDIASATGDGTNYPVKATAAQLDTSGQYDTSSGKYTFIRSGKVKIDCPMCLKGAGGATSAFLQIRYVDKAGVETLLYQAAILPDAGTNATSRWRGAIHLEKDVAKDAKVFARVVASGLGAGVVGLDSSNVGCSLNIRMA